MRRGAPRPAPRRTAPVGKWQLVSSSYSARLADTPQQRERGSWARSSSGGKGGEQLVLARTSRLAPARACCSTEQHATPASSSACATDHSPSPSPPLDTASFPRLLPPLPPCPPVRPRSAQALQHPPSAPRPRPPPPRPARTTSATPPTRRRTSGPPSAPTPARAARARSSRTKTRTRMTRGASWAVTRATRTASPRTRATRAS